MNERALILTCHSHLLSPSFSLEAFSWELQVATQAPLSKKREEYFPENLALSHTRSIDELGISCGRITLRSLDSGTQWWLRNSSHRDLLIVRAYSIPDIATCPLFPLLEMFPFLRYSQWLLQASLKYYLLIRASP